MASNIDITKPEAGLATTSSVRQNFSDAKDEIESLQANGIEGLTTAEVDQLKNIGTSTIISSQWGFLGALDQSLASTDSVAFAGLTIDTDVFFVDAINDFIGFGTATGNTDNQLKMLMNASKDILS